MSDLLQTLRDLENEVIEELARVEQRVAQRMDVPLQHLVGKRLRGQSPSPSGWVVRCCEVLKAWFGPGEDDCYEAWLEVRFDGQQDPTKIPLRDVVEVL